MASNIAPVGFGRSAWTAIRHGNQMNGIGLQATFGSGPGSAGDFAVPLFVAPELLLGGHWKVETAEIHITGAGLLDRGDAANNWSFQIALGGSGPLDTVGGLNNIDQTIPAPASYPLPVQGPESTDPQAVFLAPGDVVMLSGTMTGAGAIAGVLPLDLSNYFFMVTLYLRQTPPGR